jgi:hypothetical protein
VLEDIPTVEVVVNCQPPATSRSFGMGVVGGALVLFPAEGPPPHPKRRINVGNKYRGLFHLFMIPPYTLRESCQP